MGAEAEELGAGSPYGLLGQLVRRAIDVREGDPPERVRARLVDAFGEGERAALLGEVVGARLDSEAESARAARRDAAQVALQIARAFEALIARYGDTPVLLLLDDVQWGDTATFQAIDALLRARKGSPLCVVAAARQEVHEVFPNLWAEREVQEVRLAPLPRKACERLVHAVLGAEADRALVDRVVEQGAGNALLVEELLRAEREGHAGAAMETVIALAQARLQHLDVETRRTLRAAAIFGSVFWRDGVAAVAPDPRLDAPPAGVPRGKSHAPAHLGARAGARRGRRVAPSS